MLIEFTSNFFIILTIIQSKLFDVLLKNSKILKCFMLVKHFFQCRPLGNILKLTCPFTACPSSTHACGKLRGMQHSGQCNSAISVKVAQQNKQQTLHQLQAQPQSRRRSRSRSQSRRYIKICLRVFKKEGEWVTDLQSLNLSGNLCTRLPCCPQPQLVLVLVLVPPSYKQMNICKIHARNAAKKKRRQLTGTLTFLTTWHRAGGRCRAGRGELLTGQSDRQKSLAKRICSRAVEAAAGDHSWSWRWSWRWLKMALKRTFAKVIVKMPSQIPWARQARQLKLNFYVTMTYSQSHSPTVPQSNSPSSRDWLTALCLVRSSDAARRGFQMRWDAKRCEAMRWICSGLEERGIEGERRYRGSWKEKGRDREREGSQCVRAGARSKARAANALACKWAKTANSRLGTWPTANCQLRTGKLTTRAAHAAVDELPQKFLAGNKPKVTFCSVSQFNCK